MWKKISTTEIFTHPRLTLIEDEVELPSGHLTNYLRYKDDGHTSITVICRNERDQFLLEKEYSYPVGKKIWQFPGGAVYAGEDIEEGINRELQEEVGLYALNLMFIGSYLMNNRRTPRKMQVYCAYEFEERKLENDPEEDIEVFWLHEDEIEHKIATGEINNVSVLASLMIYKTRRK